VPLVQSGKTVCGVCLDRLERSKSLRAVVANKSYVGMVSFDRSTSAQVDEGLVDTATLDGGGATGWSCSPCSSPGRTVPSGWWSASGGEPETHCWVGSNGFAERGAIGRRSAWRGWPSVAFGHGESVRDPSEGRGAIEPRWRVRGCRERPAGLARARPTARSGRASDWDLTPLSGLIGELPLDSAGEVGERLVALADRWGESSWYDRASSAGGRSCHSVGALSCVDPP